MKIQKINNYNFTQSTQSSSNKKTGILDKIHQYTKNTSDMTDTIVVPRTIFKGYLGIMTGTTLITAGIAVQNHIKLSRFFSLAGLIASFYGTWAFVRPFVIKDAPGVSKTK